MLAQDKDDSRFTDVFGCRRGPTSQQLAAREAREAREEKLKEQARRRDELFVSLLKELLLSHNPKDDSNADLFNNFKAALRVAVRPLPKRQRQIAEIRWGLGEDNPLRSLEVIASKFGDTRERVRLIEEKVVEVFSHDPEVQAVLDKALEASS